MENCRTRYSTWQNSSICKLKKVRYNHTTMKIAIIIERADVALGGAERSIFELTTQLNTLGLDVHVLAGSGNTNTKNIHILCDSESSKKVSYKNFITSLQNHFQHNRYDIIHSTLPFEFADVYQPRGGSYKETMLQNAASYQNPIIVAYKKILNWTNKRRTQMMRMEKKLCLPQNKTIIAMLSSNVKQHFITHYNLTTDRIAVICNGVKINKPIDTFEVDRLKNQIFHQLNIKDAIDNTIFLFGANNFRLKGLASTLKAMKLTLQNNPASNPYLLVAGSGQIAKYQLLTQALGLSSRVIFLGQVRHIQNVMNFSDVAILPTWYDPASRFIIEGLAQKKPVITTEFNGSKDLFINKRHGIVTKTPADIEELSNAMNFYCSVPNRKAVKDAIEDDNIIENLSIKRHAKELIQLYHRILKGKQK